MLSSLLAFPKAKERPVLEAVKPFLDALFSGLATRGVDVRGLFLDHICYRVASDAAYEQRKGELLARGELLHEAMISGRRIAAVKLAAPIVYGERRIPLVELPAPKPGSPYAEGWEHAELVIPESFTAFMSKYSGLAWDTSATSKPHNPELRLALDGGLAVKFHHASLEDVIRAERSAT
jgi:predicted metalloenzyme YecM